MLGLKLNHVSKRGHSDVEIVSVSLHNISMGTLKFLNCDPFGIPEFSLAGNLSLDQQSGILRDISMC